MQTYKQTTDYTNAASSLMLLINHFNEKFQVNKENEYKIWQETAVLPTRASSIFALATFANKHKIKTKIIVENKEYKFPNYKFKKYNKKEVYAAKYSSNIFYDKAIKKGIKVIEKDFTLNDVKELLKQNKFVMLRVNMGIINETHPYVNYILLQGYGNNLFLFNDTYSGEIKRVPEEIMQIAFDTIKTKCKRDNRIIIFN